LQAGEGELRFTEDAEWRVDFMPGNILSFYPPWEEGEYGT
jgi:hypothetical protein